ncbi:DUF309 domain-containing protein [Gorillibacterium timonense]|uniref:DUF309 domain-containing protein n=1 Tax=Gorillibacterium timonense TaxID=1689269 RepID=UPI00071DD913|nr:DUF309 domain-containing protein [Gorillibacterium timonense]
MSYDPLYIAHLHYFNRERDYFECHEVLEELWLREGRNLLYQGLLQVAVGLYHHRNGNLNGAFKLFTGALQKLAPYPPDALGIDLNRLRRESEAYLIGLRQATETGDAASFPFYDLTIDIIDPELQEEVERLRLLPPEKHEREH